MLRLFVASMVFSFCFLSGFDVKASDYFDWDAADEAFNGDLAPLEKAAAGVFNVPREVPYRGGGIPDDGEDIVRAAKAVGAGLGSAAGKRDLESREQDGTGNTDSE